MLESSSVDSQDQSEEGRHQQNTRALLSSLFGQLCTGQGHLSQAGLLQQPWVMATAARLLGDYALWFSNLGGPEVPLEAALQLLLQALRLPQVLVLLYYTLPLQTLQEPKTPKFWSFVIITTEPLHPYETVALQMQLIASSRKITSHNLPALYPIYHLRWVAVHYFCHLQSKYALQPMRSSPFVSLHVQAVVAQLALD